MVSLFLKGIHRRALPRTGRRCHGTCSHEEGLPGVTRRGGGRGRREAEPLQVRVKEFRGVASWLVKVGT